MTFPGGAIITAAQAAVASKALADWKQVMDALAIESSKLATLADASDRSGASRMMPAIESLLATAARAAGAFASAGGSVPSDVQARWISILTRTQSAITAARALVGAVIAPQGDVLPSLLPPDSPDPRMSGWRIPGTNIVVPWVAIGGVLLVIGVGVFMKRKKS